MPFQLSIIHRFTFYEKLCVFLGLIMLMISSLLTLVGYAIWPTITGRHWVIVSPELLWFVVTIGSVLVWVGLRKAFRTTYQGIDQKFIEFMPYRILKWFFVKTFSLVSFIFVVLLDTWTDSTPGKGSSNICDQKNRTADDIWKDSPGDEYYDNDPPPPFS